MNFIKGSIQTFVVHLLIFFQGLVMIPLIIKTSGIETYGFYSILISLLGIIYGLSSFGYGYNAMRYLPSAKTIEEKSNLYITQFYFQMISMFLLSIILIIILHLGEKYKYFSIGNLSIYLIPVYLLAQVYFGQSTIYLRFTNKIKFMNIVNATNPYLFILFILISIYLFNTLKLNLIFMSNILSMTIVGSIVFYYIRKEISFKVTVPNISSIKKDIFLVFLWPYLFW